MRFACLTFFASALVSLVACAPADGSSETAAASELTATKQPSDPVATPERIPVRLTRAGGGIGRVYVPLTVSAQAEHVILDSGTARTWLRLADGAQEFTPNAFVGTIGETALSIFGRNVPPSGESLDGREVLGAIGTDWMSSGPTELDLRDGELVRYPVGFAVPGADTWPALQIERTRGIIHGHVTVDGVDHHVMIDTGSPTTLLIAEPQPDDVPRTAHDALGNPFTVFDGQGQLAIAQGLGVADVAVTRAPTFPHLSDIAQALGLPIDGLLGLSSMGEGRVLFDLAAGVVRFEPR